MCKLSRVVCTQWTDLHTFAESGVYSCQCEFIAVQTCLIACLWVLHEGSKGCVGPEVGSHDECQQTSLCAESMFNYPSAVCNQVFLTHLTCWVLQLQYAHWWAPCATAGWCKKSTLCYHWCEHCMPGLSTGTDVALTWYCVIHEVAASVKLLTCVTSNVVCGLNLFTPFALSSLHHVIFADIYTKVAHATYIWLA